MPKNSLNVSLKGADDIFSTEESRQEQQREQVQQKMCIRDRSGADQRADGLFLPQLFLPVLPQGGGHDP